MKSKLGTFFSCLVLVLMLGCTYEEIYFTDDNNKTNYVVKEDNQFGFSLHYLHNDSNFWLEDNSDILNNENKLKGTLFLRIYVAGPRFYLQDKTEYKIKSLIVNLMDGKSDKVFVEKGIYYVDKIWQQPSPVPVNLTSLKNFLDNVPQSGNFYLDIYYDEKKLKDVDSFIVEGECVLAKGKKEVKIDFNKRIYRKTRILTQLDKF